MFITYDICFSYLWELDDRYADAHLSGVVGGYTAEEHMFACGCYI